MYSRNDRLKEVFRAEITTALRTVKDPGLSGFLTITDVELSVDRKIVTVYYSIMGSPAEKKSTEKALERSAMYIRALLKKRLSLSMIPTPVFRYDDTPLKATRVDKLLDQWRQQSS